jgi:hypothetical protein
MHGETDHLTNREVLDEKFWIARGIVLNSMIYDAELTARDWPIIGVLRGTLTWAASIGRGDLR